jgi:hypothetical protein
VYLMVYLESRNGEEGGCRNICTKKRMHSRQYVKIISELKTATFAEKSGFRYATAVTHVDRGSCQGEICRRK